MLTTTPRDGFKNRHTDGLPNDKCTIKIIVKDAAGEHVYLCEWTPCDRTRYTKDNMPAEGYLGTARVIFGMYTDIGFNAWAQWDFEFVWYSVIEEPFCAQSVFVTDNNITLH